MTINPNISILAPDHLDDPNAHEEVSLEESDLADYSDLERRSLIGKMLLINPQSMLRLQLFLLRSIKNHKVFILK